jgi:adenylate cyclase
LINMRQYLLMEYKLLAEIYFESGDEKNANKIYQKYIAMQEQLQADERNNHTMSFDIEKKIADAENTIMNLTNEKKVATISRNYLIGIASLLLIIAMVVFNRFRTTRKQKIIIEKEKHRSEELLLNILPAEVAEELKDTGISKAKSFDEVTVMFTDFKGFTQISEKLGAEKTVAEIDYCFSAFDNIINKHGIEKIKTIGDAYMCVGGLPKANSTHADDIVKAALEIRDFMNSYNREKLAKGEIPFEIRIGINTGPVVAGIVGVKKFAYDIWGDTVNLASRMESHGKEGEVNISGSTFELVKDKFTCSHRGKIQTKNKGEVDMYFVS